MASDAVHEPSPPGAPMGSTPTPPLPTPPLPVPEEPSPLPSAAEAAALAGVFAVDYLSWDEDDADRRGRVLRDHMLTTGADPAQLGWSGQGRQRAEFALPGLVTATEGGRLLVDVRVRVTPYRSVGDHGAPAQECPEPVGDGVPAVAPAPTGRGWRSLASRWVRLAVPISRRDGRLVVDGMPAVIDPPRAPSSPGALPAVEDPLAEPDSGTPR